VPPVKELLPVSGFLSGKEFAPVLITIDDPRSVTFPADVFDVERMVEYRKFL
jgi:hypothetical protein